MRKFHLMNEANRDATIAIESVSEAAGPKLGVPGKTIAFRRYLAATQTGLHDTLLAEHGNGLAQALIDGDPEIDLEQVGRVIGDTTPIYLSGDGAVMHVSPTVVDVLVAPDGTERDSKPSEDTPANVNEPDAVRIAGRKIPKKEAITKFAFRRTIAIRHVDGLTYDFLFGIAKQLADEGVLAMLGAGPRGREPLVFQENGSPYRGFLEGRVDGERFVLLLHLSNLELRVPT